MLLENSKLITPQKPKPQHWTNFAIGRSKFHMSAVVNTQQKTIGIILVIKGDNAKAHFNQLFQNKDEIDSELSEKVEWREMLDKKESRIKLNCSADPWDRSAWRNQQAWLRDKLEEFHKVFSKRIKSLDADEYQEE